jgi:bacterial/archaeal transporter family-2 protein
MTAAILAAALAVGALLAVQASVNLQLGAAVRSPYSAAALQIGLATALIAVLAAVTGSYVGPGGTTWWHLLGGLASPLYVTAGILLFPRLGAVVAVGLFVTGQVLASLVLDLGGLLDVPRRSWSVALVAGAAAVLAGITAVVRGQRAAGPARPRPGWLALGVLAGAALPVQGAVNALLRRDLGEPLAVGLVSFVVASATIVVALLVLLALRRTPAPRLAGLRAVPWWGWLGGACAAAYVVATFLLIPRVGAAATVAFTVTGQQLASAAVDHFGLFRLPRRPLTASRGGGLAVLVGSSLLVQLG